jgi:hypothetical protein
MADDPTQAFAKHNGSTELVKSPVSGIGPATVSTMQTGLAEKKLADPNSFSGQEEPTLTSPSSRVPAAQASVDERLSQVQARVDRMQEELMSVKLGVQELARAIGAEQRRGRSARMGHYLLWVAVIAAMATFWMLTRLRLGIS